MPRFLSSALNSSSAYIRFTARWQSSKLPLTAATYTLFPSCTHICKRCIFATPSSGKNTATFVPGTFLKPSNAALPVSPLVAAKMSISSWLPVTSQLRFIKYGNTCNAISLNAHVGPWNSSKTYKFSLIFTSGAGSSPSNEAYAFSHVSLSQSAPKSSAKYLPSTNAARSGYVIPAIFSISSALIFGNFSGTYKPPSLAKPCTIASAPVTFSPPLVLIKYIILPTFIFRVQPCFYAFIFIHAKTDSFAAFLPLPRLSPCLITFYYKEPNASRSALSFAFYNLSISRYTC